jgi:hypothetical protein
MRYILLLFIIAGCHSATDVKKSNPNDTLYIKPNAFLAYDSTIFSSSQQSADMYYTSGVELSLKNAKGSTMIHFNAGPNFTEPSLAMQDSTIEKRKSGVATMKEFDDANMPEVEKKIRHVYGFSCFASTLYNPTGKSYTTSIKGLSLFKDGYCYVDYYALGQDDIEHAYKIMEDILAGFTSHPYNELRREDSIVAASYTVSIDSSAVSQQEAEQQKITHAVIVHAQQPLKHTVKGAMFKGRFFKANEKGEVRITISDYMPGPYEHKGTYVVMNAFGKLVEIPFTVFYTVSKK